jgi:hypothetical protein
MHGITLEAILAVKSTQIQTHILRPNLTVENIFE